MCSNLPNASGRVAERESIRPRDPARSDQLSLYLSIYLSRSGAIRPTVHSRPSNGPRRSLLNPLHVYKVSVCVGGAGMRPAPYRTLSNPATHSLHPTTNSFQSPKHTLHQSLADGQAMTCTVRIRGAMTSVPAQAVDVSCTPLVHISMSTAGAYSSAAYYRS